MHAARSAQAPQVSAGQGGFSSDEDETRYDDADYEDDPRSYDYEGNRDAEGDVTPRASVGAAQAARNYISTRSQQRQQGYDEYDEEYDDAGQPLHDDEEEESDEEMDEDDEDDDLSSSPSIPDENIDFDLVYALHSFAATVEGQATVDKGNSLMLLDDSNSYWWLVRVLKTQEVGYIPAENIETPYERLARLNKHRNVGLTSATDDDHIQVPSKIYSSHLVKQRHAGGRSGVSPHSGKLSALSRRRDGAPSKTPSPQPMSKPSVIFGPPSYVEHSGDEFETDEEEYEGEDDEGEYDEEDEEEEGDYDEDEEQDGIDDGDQDTRGDVDDEELRAQMEHGHGAGAPADVRSRRGDAQQQQQQPTSSAAKTPAERKALLAGMEPDDGMDWDAADVERMQREKASQSQQQSQQQPQGLRDPSKTSLDANQRRTPGSSWDNALMSEQQPDVQQVGIGRPGQQQQQQQRGASGGHPQRPVHHLRKTSSERTVSSTASSEGPLLPSEVQAGRDRNVSTTSTVSVGSAAGAGSYHQPGGPYGRGSPMPVDARKDRTKRKSKGSIDVHDDSIASSTGSAADEKGAKKRSGVFSGLFSRNKDKKDRKSGSISSTGGGDDSSIIARNSEDIENYKQREAAAAAAAAAGAGGGAPATGMGRTVQERDRARQEAYSRQFLTNNNAAANRSDSFTARNGSGKPRPGSLMGTPNTVPMLNVLRVFAGDDIESDATFKTVLLNDSTSTRDLMRQAMQRFRLPQVAGGYVLTVKSLEGNERGLGEEERPLQVFDSLSDLGPEAPTMPSVKRSSVGSISSISSNLSLNPAIVRANDDFGDDHAVKFYLRRRIGRASASQSESIDAGESSYTSPSSYSQGGSADTAFTTTTAMARFGLRLLIFPGDLPEGLKFDPQSPALIQESLLAERGPSASIPSNAIEQRYRERILSLPRNATVAEVIETGLNRFGIADGVVEGGDDVEDRTTRRRSKPRVKYGLAVEARQQQRQERPLPPISKVLDAFPQAPLMRAPPPSNKRRSADSATLLSMAEEQLRPEDPVFILRIIGSRQHDGLAQGLAPGHHYPAKSTVRSLSPTEGRLADRQDQRRQEELSTIRDATAAAAAPASTASSAASSSASASATPRSLIAAQRAAAQERKAAVLGAQRNDQQGVDLYLVNDAKIRSSRSLQGGKVRYSYLPGLADSEELDISAIVEDVLADQNRSLSPPAQPSSADTLRPGGPLRDFSTTTLNTFESAPSTPIAQSPIDLSEANIDYVGAGGNGSGTAPLSFGGKSAGGKTLTHVKSNRDLLEGFVKNSQNSESTIESRIDQVLLRVAGGGVGNPTEPTPTGPMGKGKAPSTTTATPRQASNGSATTSGSTSHNRSGSEELSSSIHDSPRSASTNPTPLSTLAAGAGAVGAGATVTGAAAGARSRAAPPSSSSSSLPPAAYIPSDDFGLDHLYTIVDAAMRRDPKKYTRVVVQPPSQTSSGTSTPPASKHNSTVMTLAPKREPIRAQVAGLFGPNEEHFGSGGGLSPSSSSSRGGVYAPIRGQLDRVEDSLDALLADVQRVL